MYYTYSHFGYITIEETRNLEQKITYDVTIVTHETIIPTINKESITISNGSMIFLQALSCNMKNNSIILNPILGNIIPQDIINVICEY